MVLLVGYLLFSRAFAYIGVPSAQLFIGDIFLAAFFVLRPRDSGRLWLTSLLRGTELSLVAWALYLFLAYGLVLAARGIVDGYDRVQAVQNLVFNIYPFYIFFGLWLGLRDRGFLSRFVMILAWANALYGIVYISYLNGLNIVIPNTPGVYLFNTPQGQMVAILGLISFHKDIRRTWLPLLINFLLLIGLQVRAHWAGFLLAVPAWALLSRRVGRTFVIGVVLVSLLAAAFVVDLKVPESLSRGPQALSARAAVGAAIAPFDEQAAAQLNPQAGLFAGTAQWRTHWWSDIWDSVYSSTNRLLFGFGYGYYLKSTSTISSGKDNLRTPHNIFFYALGFGGWLGVATFLFLLAAVARLLWIAYRRTGQAFGLSVFFLGIGIGLFTNYFETPFAGIPYWMLIGLSAAPALKAWTSGDAPAEGLDDESAA